MFQCDVEAEKYNEPGLGFEKLAFVAGSEAGLLTDIT